MLQDLPRINPEGEPGPGTAAAGGKSGARESAARQSSRVLSGHLQMPSDKSFKISGLDSLLPFTLVMILLRQSKHETPSGSKEEPLKRRGEQPWWMGTLLPTRLARRVCLCK